MANHCKQCGDEFTPKYKTTEMFCSSICSVLYKKERYEGKKKKQPIKKVSDKRRSQLYTYSMMKKAYMDKHRVCIVCNTKDATDIHHMKGRENELLLDINYWLPVCRECHRKITDDSAWAIRMGYSYKRNGQTDL
jgi:uncharacterized Zn finger protein (UPF0148 family)